MQIPAISSIFICLLGAAALALIDGPDELSLIPLGIAAIVSLVALKLP
jgi:hypothetical protein